METNKKAYPVFPLEGLYNQGSFKPGLSQNFLTENNVGFDTFHFSINKRLIIFAMNSF